MPTTDVIADNVIAETGAAFPVSVIKKKIIETARDFCKFNMALNKPVQQIVESSTADASKNYAQSITVSPYTDTEPCGIFGLTVNGYKLASVERDAVSPSSSASPLYHQGGIYFDFSNSTTCLIHPLQAGGDVRFFVGFRPALTASQIDDEFWGRYGQDIMFGIKSKLFMMSGYRSTAIDLAVGFGAEYERLKKRARGEVNRMVIGEYLCS